MVSPLIVNSFVSCLLLEPYKVKLGSWSIGMFVDLFIGVFDLCFFLDLTLLDQFYILGVIMGVPLGEMGVFIEMCVWSIQHPGRPIMVTK